MAAFLRYLLSVYFSSVDGECVGLLDHGECHPHTGICLCQAQRPVQIGATCVKGKSTIIQGLYKGAQSKYVL